MFSSMKTKQGISRRTRLDFWAAFGLAASVFLLCDPLSARGDIIVTVAPTQDYCDQANGTLAVPIMIPSGTTQLEFRATGGVATFGSTLYSPDGLDSNGHPSGFRQTMSASV